MNDEQQLRSLLALAAEPSEHLQPPVAQLVRRGRRVRKVRAACSVLGAAAIAAAAFALPTALRGPNGVATPDHGGGPPHRATAVELARSHWTVLPHSPLGPRTDPIVVPAGPQVFELGGVSNGRAQSDGALFNTENRRWQLIDRPPRAVGLNGAVSVWTGWSSHQVFVTSGKVAGLYDPLTNRWTTTELPRQMAGLQLAAPVWTGHDVVLAGTSGSTTKSKLVVAAYSVAGHSWRIITPRLPVGHPTGAIDLVATWDRVILWSLWSRDITFSQGGAIHSGVDVLVLGHGKWTAFTGDWPQHRLVQGATFADDRILIPPGQFWCGDCPAPFSESPARFADPASLNLTTIPNSPLVTLPLIQPPVWLWNGNTVVAADASGSSRAAPDGRLGRLAAYDPSSRRWYVLPNAPGKPALAAVPIFVRQRLLVLTRTGGLLVLQKGS